MTVKPWNRPAVGAHRFSPGSAETDVGWYRN